MVFARNKQYDYEQKVQKHSHVTFHYYSSYCIRSGCLAMD